MWFGKHGAVRSHTNNQQLCKCKNESLEFDHHSQSPMIEVECAIIETV